MNKKETRMVETGQRLDGLQTRTLNVFNMRLLLTYSK